MILVLSGEGVSDIGRDNAGNFEPGPMARLADAIIQDAQEFNYSYIENKAIRYVEKKEISNSGRPKLLLTGKKRMADTPENKWFLRNAAALARKAAEIEKEANDSTLAILFRDADKPEEYRSKRSSIEHGFKFEAYRNGVAMVPCPTSEAWLISSVLGGGTKLDGKNLEEWKKRDVLKIRLGELLEGQEVKDMDPSPDSISMMLTSYSDFRRDLELSVRTINDRAS